MDKFTDGWAIAKKDGQWISVKYNNMTFAQAKEAEKDANDGIRLRPMIDALSECVRAYDATGGAKGLAMQTAAEGARLLLARLNLK